MRLLGRTVDRHTAGGAHGRRGAGPTGARPEHLRECLAARKRAVVTRLLKAVACLSEAGAAGTLPESAAWLRDSRLVYLRKPGTDTPRPIRVGELWRRVVAKGLASASREHLQRLFLAHRQCGDVSVPSCYP